MFITQFRIDNSTHKITAIKAGNVTVTATHKPTGLAKMFGVTVNVPFPAPPSDIGNMIFPEEWLFAIEEANDDWRLAHDDDDIMLNGPLSRDAVDFGKQIWYNELDKNSGAYVLYNMGRTDSTRLNNYVLTEVKNGALELAPLIGAPSGSQLWMFYSDSDDKISIKNYASEHLLKIEDSIYVIASNVGDKWNLIAREKADEFMKDGGGAETSFFDPNDYSAGRKVAYKIVDNTYPHFSSSVIREGAHLWNDVSSKIVIYYPGDTYPTDHDLELTIEIVAASFIDSEDVIGKAVGIKDYKTENEKEQKLYSGFSTFRIYIKNSLTDKKAKCAVAHEIGHVLNLLHSFDCDYANDTSMLSVMNYENSTLSAEEDNITYEPSWLDKVNIIKRWGN